MNNGTYITSFCLFVVLVQFFGSCDRQEQADIDKNSLPNDDLIVETEVNNSSTKDMVIAKLMEDFQKPLHTYPKISNNESVTNASGVVYRKGIKEPFTGRIVEYHENGNISLDASYLDGLAHGIQVKYFDSGTRALEAIFNGGVLEGTKTRWWENGTLREEQYWNNGKYAGRKLWDDTGRLLREELVKQQGN